MTLDQQEILEAAWTKYRETGDIEARNQLMLHYASLVRYIAFKVMPAMPSSVEREDLISYGQFGLIKALKSFDPARGVKFETYAGGRIRGSIIDELRVLDWVPRGVRSKTREIDKAIDELQTSLGRTPEDSELADHLGVTIAEVWKLRSAAHSSGQIHALQEDWHANDEDGSQMGTFAEALHDVDSAPEDHYDVIELGDILGTVIHALPERDKMILALCYLEEMTLAEVGAILGVTESRVSQLQGRILQDIREKLGRQVFVAA